MWAKGFSRFLQTLYQDESGQSTLEYMVIFSASVIGATQLARQLQKAMDLGILRLGGELERDLKTGRAKLRVWSN